MTMDMERRRLHGGNHTSKSAEDTNKTNMANGEDDEDDEDEGNKETTKLLTKSKDASSATDFADSSNPPSQLTLSTRLDKSPTSGFDPTTPRSPSGIISNSGSFRGCQQKQTRASQTNQPRSVHFDKRRPQTLELDLSASPASAVSVYAAAMARGEMPEEASETVSVEFEPM